MSGGGGSGFEWVLLAVGGVLTLGPLIFFVVVIRRSDDT